MKNEVLLSEVTQSCFGLYERPDANNLGDLRYLQGADFDNDGLIKTKVSASIDSKKIDYMSHILTEGDVLLAIKGLRNFSWAYDESAGDAVASSLFLVLNCDREKLLPGYLALFFNQPRTQAKLKTLSAGITVQSISKGEVMKMKIDLPPLNEQARIVKLAQMMQQEIELTERIMEKLKVKRKAVLAELMNKKQTASE